tara:strand:+ start:1305 stop:2606 length:1302 start_codon:yes stop_codon:yes gene_type:complete
MPQQPPSVKGPFFPTFPPPDTTNTGNPSSGGLAHLFCSWTEEVEVCETGVAQCAGTWSAASSAGGSSGGSLSNGSCDINVSFDLACDTPQAINVTANCSDGTTVVLDEYYWPGKPTNSSEGQYYVVCQCDTSECSEEGGLGSDYCDQFESGPYATEAEAIAAVPSYDGTCSCTATTTPCSDTAYNKTFTNVCETAPPVNCRMVEIPGSWSDMIPLTASCGWTVLAGASEVDKNIFFAKVAQHLINNNPGLVQIIRIHLKVGLSASDTSAVMQFLKLMKTTSGSKCLLQPPPNFSDSSVLRAISDAVAKHLNQMGKGAPKPPTGGGINFGLPVMIIMPTLDMLHEKLNEQMNQFNSFDDVKCAMNVNPGGGGIGTTVGPGNPGLSLPLNSVVKSSSSGSSLNQSTKNNILLHINNGFPALNGRLSLKTPKAEYL